MSNNHAVKCRLCGNQGYKYVEDNRIMFHCPSCGLNEYMKIFAMEYWHQRKIKLGLRES